MLFQFALLVWALLAIAALAIDMGFISLTRTQMQMAAETAALEGLRWRDNSGPNSDAFRRTQASGIVASLFTDPSGERQLGAGPDIPLSGGETEFNALQTIGPPPYGFYVPDLQPNTPQNLAYGDMVSGCYIAPPPPEPPGAENSDYIRNDFVLAEDASGGCPASSAAARSFLIRLRRTNDFQGFDNQPGVSSAGTALPLLFGRATTIHSDSTNNPNNYNPRVHGITLRGTAIADTQPALRIGILRATPFALERSFWESLVVGSPSSVVVGVQQAPSGNIASYYSSPLTTAGQPAAPTAPYGSASGEGFVPIYQDISGINRVIGFGAVTWTGGGTGEITVTRSEQRVASANATRHVSEGISGLTSVDLASVMQANQELFLNGAILVPVLVR
jgi:hypothetical protein